jgi:hypothetical protein
MSAAAAVMLPWYEDFFTATKHAAGRRRLVELRCDVDVFVRHRVQSPPPWVTGDSTA